MSSRPSRIIPFVCLAIFLPAASQRAAERECELTLELVQAETGRRVAGLVRVETADGTSLALDGLLSRGKGLAETLPINGWFVLPGRASVRVPRAPLAVEALRGLETVKARQEVDLTGKETASLSMVLRPFSRLGEEGWLSGNTHLHLMKLTRAEADRYLREIPRADALDLVFLSYLERAGDDRFYTSNQYAQSDLDALSTDGVLFAGGEEHRHNFSAYGEGYGHVMFLDLRRLIRPVSLGPGISKTGTDGRTLREGIEAARAQGAGVIWCHNRFGLEDIPTWVACRLDAQNIFDGGAHGSYGDTFYRYLNLGRRVPFSTGTDWFIYDFARVYVRLGGEPLSAQSWLRALAAGRSFITNGPLLRFEVDGRQVGETIRLARAGSLGVAGSAAGRDDFKRLELVRNGKVIATAASRAEGGAQGGYFSARLEAQVEVAEPSWFALRTPPPPLERPREKGTVGLDEFGRPLFAHTSPVYVELGGRRVFDEAMARGLIAEIEADLAVIEEKALFADDREKDRVVRVYREAVETLEGWVRASSSE